MYAQKIDKYSIYTKPNEKVSQLVKLQLANIKKLILRYGEFFAITKTGTIIDVTHKALKDIQYNSESTLLGIKSVIKSIYKKFVLLSTGDVYKFYSSDQITKSKGELIFEKVVSITYHRETIIVLLSDGTIYVSNYPHNEFKLYDSNNLTSIRYFISNGECYKYGRHVLSNIIDMKKCLLTELFMLHGTKLILKRKLLEKITGLEYEDAYPVLDYGFLSALGNDSFW